MSLVIDAHNHVGVRATVQQTGKELVAKLDKVGVDKAVVFPFPEGDFENAVATDYAKEFPDRLIPFCVVNAWNTEAAYKELTTCLKDQGFKGLKLHPTLHGYHLCDFSIVDPIFEIAQQYNIPILVHGAADIYNSPSQFYVMAKRFPKVNLIMAHAGYFWAVDQAVQLAKETPNLYLDVSRIPVFEITSAVKEVGPNQIIWGTDSPFVDYEWEFKKMARTTDSKEGYDLIVGGNIARLLEI
ncbi:MAG: amidohydrolase family protein [Ruminiclostridium sp.]